jgi:hypothetical protein
MSNRNKDRKFTSVKVFKTPKFKNMYLHFLPLEQSNNQIKYKFESNIYRHKFVENEDYAINIANVKQKFATASFDRLNSGYSDNNLMTIGNYLCC